MKNRRWYVKFTNVWTNKVQINSFDTEKEAVFFANQINGEILDWKY